MQSSQTLALIPARENSKGIPSKNLKVLGDRPLLAHAIACAQATPGIDRTVVSTDSEEIASVARDWGAEVPFMRPANLATDDAPMIGVILHALEALAADGWRADVLALLQPTAPFRRAEDVSSALSILREDPSADSVVSVEAVPSHYSPHYVMKIEGGQLQPFLEDGARLTRRQDAPPAYSRNGQFYVARVASLLETRSLYGRVSRAIVTSHEAVNLDEPKDWRDAVELLNQRSQASLHEG